jgi:hypothetical protein
MRAIVDVLKADSGRAINIFETKNYKLRVGDLYFVEFKVGNTTECFESRLIDTTPEDRTLIFNHPELVNRTIGIPNWNIVKLNRL